MKLQTLVATVALSLSGAAFADEFNQKWFNDVMSNQSRAAVRAELAANGPLANGEAGYQYVLSGFEMAKSRSAVRADLLANGPAAGEAGQPFGVATIAFTQAGAQVVAEAR